MTKSQPNGHENTLPDLKQHTTSITIDQTRHHHVTQQGFRLISILITILTTIIVSVKTSPSTSLSVYSIPSIQTVLPAPGTSRTTLLSTIVLSIGVKRLLLVSHLCVIRSRLSFLPLSFLFFVSFHSPVLVRSLPCSSTRMKVFHPGLIVALIPHPRFSSRPFPFSCFVLASPLINMGILAYISLLQDRSPPSFCRHRCCSWRLLACPFSGFSFSVLVFFEF